MAKYKSMLVSHSLIKRSLILIEILIFIALISCCCVSYSKIIDNITNSQRIWFFFIVSVVLAFFGCRSLISQGDLKFNKLDAVIFLSIIYAVLNNYLKGGYILSKNNIEDIGLLTAFFFPKYLTVLKKKTQTVLVIFILILTAIQISVAALQWFTFIPSFNDNFKFTGFFINPSPFAIFLSCLLIFCLSFSLYNPIKRIRVIALILFLAGIVIVVISFSRSAWIGLFIGIVSVYAIKFDAYKYVKQSFKKDSAKKAVFYLIFLCAGLVLFNIYNLKKDSADGRILIWKISSKIMFDHPIMGIGQNNFKVLFSEYQSKYFHDHPNRMETEGRFADQVLYAFNDPLQIMVEQGIIGLLSFILILSILFKVSKIIISQQYNVNDRSLNFGGLASVLVILSSGLTSYPLMILPIKIFFFVCLGILSRSYSDFEKPVIRIKNASLGITNIIFSSVFFIAGFCYLRYSFNMFNAYTKGAVMDNKHENWVTQDYEKYTPILYDEEWFIIMKCKKYINHERYDLAIHELESAKKITSDRSIYYLLGNLYKHVNNISKAQEQFEFVYFAVPNLLTPKYLLAKFYFQTKQLSKWEKMYDEIINFKPKGYSRLSDEMIFEIKMLKNSK